jgi:hypothetical protein
LAVCGLPDTTFPFATNTFTANPGVNPFFTLDISSVSPFASDILEFSISEITASQRAALGSTLTNSVVVSGKGVLRSTNPDNSADAETDFSASLVLDPDTGTWVSDGGLTIVVRQPRSTPEASTTMGLLALGALGGSSVVFKKRNKVA